eukprot:g3229.t1
MDEMRAAQGKAMDEMRAAQSKSADEMRAAHAKEVARIEHAHAEQLTMLRENHAAEVASLREAARSHEREVEARHAAALEEEKRRHAEEVEAMKADLQQQVDAANELLAEAEAKTRSTSLWQLAQEEKGEARIRDVLMRAGKLATMREMDELFTSVIEEVSEVVKADRATLWVADYKQNVLWSKVAEGSEPIRVPLSAGIVGETVALGRVVNVPDAYADSRFNRDVDKRTGYRTKSILCVPVKDGTGHGATVIGAVQVINKLRGDEDSNGTLDGDEKQLSESDCFDKEDEQLLDAFCKSIGASISNCLREGATKADLATSIETVHELQDRLAGALEGQRQSEERSKRLSELTQSISGKLKLDELFENVIRTTSNLLQADRGTLFLLDEETNELYSKVAEKAGGTIRLPSSSGLVGYTATSGEILCIDDAYEDDRFSRAFDQRTGYRTRSVMCCPIKGSQGRIIGVLQLINKVGGKHFHEEDKALAKDFCKQLAHAVANAQHHEIKAQEVERSQQELSSLNSQLQIIKTELVREREQKSEAKDAAKESAKRAERLLEMSRNVASQQQIDSIFESVMSDAQELVSADRATLFLVDKRRQQLWSKVAQGASTIRVPIDAGIVGLVATTKEVLNIEDAHEHPSFNPAIDKKTKYRTRSVLCVPILSRSHEGATGEATELVGIVQAINKIDDDGEPCLFTADDEQLLEAFCAHISVSVVNCHRENATREELASSMLNMKHLQSRLKDAKTALQREGKLMEMSRSIMSGLTADGLFMSVVGHARELLGADRATLFLVDKKADELYSRVAEGADEIRIPMDKGIVGEAATSQSIVNIPDAYESKLFNRSVDVATGYTTKEVLCFPILEDGGGETLGVLQVINRVSGGAFDDEDERLGEELARHIATAVLGMAKDIESQEKLRVLKERMDVLAAEVASRDEENLTQLEEHKRHSASLLKITRSLASQRELDGIFAAVMRDVCVLVGAERATLFLVDKEARVLWSKVADGMDPIRVPLSAGIVGEVFQKRHALNIPDAYLHPTFNGSIDKKTGFITKAVLCMPVFSLHDAETVVGIVQVMNKRIEPFIFDADDEKLLSAFCAQIAVSVENCEKEEATKANLQASLRDAEALKAKLEEAMTSQRAASEEAERHKIILDLAASLTDMHSLDEMIAATVQKARELIGADRGSLFVLDHDGTSLWSQVAEGAKERFKIPVKKGIVGYAVANNETVNIANAYEDDRFDPTFDKKTGYKTVSILCVPIVTRRQRVVGAVQLINKLEGTSFTDEESAIVQNLAQQIAGALSVHVSSEQDKRRDAKDSKQKMDALQTQVAFLDAQLQQEKERGITSISRTKEQSQRLLEMSRNVASQQQIDSIFESVMSDAQELVSADRATLFLVDKRRQQLWSKVAQGASTIRVPIDAGIVGLVATTKEVLNIEDAHEHPSFNPAIDKKTKYRTRSVLCVPILSRSHEGATGEATELVGIVQAINKIDDDGEPCLFTADDEQLLEAFCAHISVSVVNCHRENATREELASSMLNMKHLQSRLKDAKTALQREGKLMEMSRSIMSGLTADGLFMSVVGHARELLGADRATLFLVDKKADELYSRVAEGADEIRIPMDKGIVGEAATSQSIVNIPDAYESKLFNRSVDVATGYTTKEVLCFPILEDGGGETLGVLQVINRVSGGAFDDEDERLGEELARHIATAVIGVHRDAVSSRKLHDLEKRLNVATKTAQQNAQEAEAALLTTKSKSNLLMNITRDLASSAAFDDIFHNVMTQTSALMDCDRATLFLIDESKRELWSKVATGAAPIRIPLTAGIVGAAVAGNCAINVPDAYKDSRFHTDVDRRTGYRTRTILCMPVRNVESGKMVGVMQVINKNGEGGAIFSADDEKLLEAFCSHIAVAVEQCQRKDADRTSIQESMNGLRSLQRQLEEAQMREAKLAESRSRSEFVLELSRTLSESTEINVVIERVVQQATDLLSAERATLFVVDREKRELWSRVAQGTNEIRVPIDKGIVGHVATHNEVVNIEDAYEDGRFNKSIDMKTGYRTRAILALPVVDGTGSVCAVLQCMNKRDGTTFGSDDEGIAQQFAVQIGIAVSNSLAKGASEKELQQSLKNLRYLQDEMQAMEAKLNEQRREAQTSEERSHALMRVTQSLMAKSELHAVFSVVMSDVKSLLSCERATLFLYDEGRGQLYSHVSKDVPEIRVPTTAGLVGHVFGSKEPLRIDDAHADSRFNPEVDRRTGFRTRAVLCVPVADADGRVIGVCQAINKVDGDSTVADGRFTADDVKVLQTFTQQVAAAVENCKQIESQNVAMMEAKRHANMVAAKMQEMEASLGEKMTTLERTVGALQLGETMLNDALRTDDLFLIVREKVPALVLASGAYLLLNEDSGAATPRLWTRETGNVESSGKAAEVDSSRRAVPASGMLLSAAPTFTRSAHETEPLALALQQNIVNMLVIPLRPKPNELLGVIVAVNLQTGDGGEATSPVALGSIIGRFASSIMDRRRKAHATRAMETGLKSKLQKMSSERKTFEAKLIDYEKRLTNQLSDLRGKLSACKEEKADAMKQVHAYQQDLADQKQEYEGKVESLKASLEAVTSAGGAVAKETMSMTAVFATVVAQSRKLVHADRATLFVVDEENKELFSRVAEGSKEIRVKVGAGIAGSVAQTGETINIVDAYNDPRFNPAFDKQTGYRTKQILCMAVLSPGGKIIAVLQLINRTVDGPFGPEEADIIRALCGQIGTTVQNAMHFEASKKAMTESSRQLAAMQAQLQHLESELAQESARSSANDKLASRASKLVEISRNVAAQSELDKVFVSVMEEARSLLECDRATLFLIDESKRELWSKVATGAAPIRIPLTAGIVGAAVAGNCAINVPDAYKDSRFHTDVDRRTGYRTRTILCMPVRNVESGKMVGVMQVINKNGEGGAIFSADDEKLLEAFCSHIAVAVEQCQRKDADRTSIQESMNGLRSLQRQLEEAQMREAKLAESRSRSEFVLELSRTLSESTEINVVIERVVQQATDLLSAERATLFVVDREKRELWSRVAQGTNEIRVPIDKGIVGHVATHNEVVNIEDAYEDGRFNKSIDMKTGYRTRAILALPVVDGTGSVCAVLQCMNKRDGTTFGSDDEGIAQQFAVQIGIAVSNSLAKGASEKELQQSLKNLRYLQDEMQAMEAKLNEQRREAQTSEERSHALMRVTQSLMAKSELHAVFSVVMSDVKSLLSCERATLFLYDEGRGQLYSHVSKDVPEIRVPTTAGLVGHVFGSKEPLRIDDAHADSRFNPEVDRRTGFRTRAVLCVPVADADGRVIGVCQAINKVNGDSMVADGTFSKSDVSTLQGICTQVAAVVERCKTKMNEVASVTASQKHAAGLSERIARMEVDSIRQSEKLHRMEKALELVAGIGFQQLGMNEMVDVVSSSLPEIVNAEHAVVLLTDDAAQKESGKERLVARISRSGLETLNVRVPIAGLWSSEEATIATSTDEAEKVNDEQTEAIDNVLVSEIRSRLWAPFTVAAAGGKPLLGGIYVINKKGTSSSFTTNDKLICSKIATSLCTAVSKLRSDVEGKQSQKEWNKKTSKMLRSLRDERNALKSSLQTIQQEKADVDGELTLLRNKFSKVNDDLETLKMTSIESGKKHREELATSSANWEVRLASERERLEKELTELSTSMELRESESKAKIESLEAELSRLKIRATAQARQATEKEGTLRLKGQREIDEFKSSMADKIAALERRSEDAASRSEDVRREMQRKCDRFEAESQRLREELQVTKLDRDAALERCENAVSELSRMETKAAAELAQVKRDSADVETTLAAEARRQRGAAESAADVTAQLRGRVEALETELKSKRELSSNMIRRLEQQLDEAEVSLRERQGQVEDMRTRVALEEDTRRRNEETISAQSRELKTLREARIRLSRLQSDMDGESKQRQQLEGTVKMLQEALDEARKEANASRAELSRMAPSHV